MNDWRMRPHRRYNPLRDEWVLVSPHRLQRPWQGAVSAPAAAARPRYDPQCYLCPGNTRASGSVNPAYEHTFVFDNDYAALLMDTPVDSHEDGLLRARGEAGRCRVLCFSPRHDLDIAAMKRDEIGAVVDAWAQQFVELGADPAINAITIFENRGQMMGASNPHPHGQIWAQSTPPDELVRESHAQDAYLRQKGSCLLCDYVHQELESGERVIYANDSAAVLVPFWAVWPFEAIVIPRVHVSSIDALAAAARLGVADALGVLTAKYDRVFGAPFPYSMGFHQRPTDGQRYDAWHAHAHYFPPLLRSESIRKFLVGFELLAQPQRDITPETAAARLRSL